MSVVVRVAGKVNLCLRVLGRRADGYHEVETVLQSIGVWDRVHLASLPGTGRIALEVDTPGVPLDGSNLCWQAARLLAERARVAGGAAIRLEKAIPTRAGLGGGSADAAAALAGLAVLWELAIEPSDLDSMAADLGADVPFFLKGGCCLARGRGDEIDPLPDVDAWLVVVVPRRRVPTAQAYAVLRRGSTRGRRRALQRATQRVVSALEAGDVRALAGALHNDFETADLPGIAEARQAREDLLRAGCLGARLSGSGSAVFGIAEDREQADGVADALRRTWPWVKVAPTVSVGEGLVIRDEEGE